MLRFDAYTATSSSLTVRDAKEIILEGGWRVGAESKPREVQGFHGFECRQGFVDYCGSEFAAVQWGGQHGDRVMLEVKGEATGDIVQLLRAEWPHRCTRVDSCGDFDGVGEFSRLYGVCTQVKRQHGILGGKAGDWDDFPEKGRTLYLGSRTSPVRVRLYEKGKQPEYAHLERPDWVRLEIQVRPKKEAKSAFSALSPEEVWGASKWTSELHSRLLGGHIDPHPAGTVYRLTDDERSFEWFCTQYEGVLTRQMEACGGWEAVGLNIGDKIAELQERRARRQGAG